MSAAAATGSSPRPGPGDPEKAALRFVALSFFALAGYLVVDSVLALSGHGEARPHRWVSDWRR